MQSLWPLLVINLVLCNAQPVKDDVTNAFIELTELGYEDPCYEAAEAEWSFVNVPSNKTLSVWREKVRIYYDLKKDQKNEVQNISHLDLSDPSFKYKYEVIERPGDALVNDTRLDAMFNFVGMLEILKATPISTEKAKNYTYKDIEHTLSHSSDLETVKSLWAAWHERFTPLAENLSNNFDVLQEAATDNGADSVTEYWELLSGFEGGYEKIKYEWSTIENLYKKIFNFARMMLSEKYNFNTSESIPVYVLGSLQADDWLPASVDLTSNPNLMYGIRKNLWKKKLIGSTMYKTASNMGTLLLNQVPTADFWEQSEFNRQCPAKLINFCKDGVMRVSTCYEPTLSNFLMAHKNVGKILFNQMSVEATPVLNTANRYSGLEEGVAELFGILSASPAWLRHTDVISNSTDNDERLITSLTITALNVLPRLGYYLAADMWRINAIETGIVNSTELVSSWWKYREEYEGVTSNGTDLPTFLNDEYIVRNKPYLPKFVGTLLAFQLYEYLMDNTEVRYDRILEKQTNPNFIKMIQHGAADNWMHVLEKSLEIDDISASALKSFFVPLVDFIDELDEDFKVAVNDNNKKELEEIEKQIIKEINTPTTTTTPTTTIAAVTKRRMTNTTTKPQQSSQANDTRISGKTLDSKSSLQVQDDHSKQNNSQKLETTTKVPFDESLINNLTEEEQDSKPKMNTSKAVWAVGAVLVATIVICIIAIFGRQRCRKTPKNRRYV